MKGGNDASACELWGFTWYHAFCCKANNPLFFIKAIFRSATLFDLNPWEESRLIQGPCPSPSLTSISVRLKQVTRKSWNPFPPATHSLTFHHSIKHNGWGPRVVFFSPLKTFFPFLALLMYNWFMINCIYLKGKTWCILWNYSHN